MKKFYDISRRCPRNGGFSLVATLLLLVLLSIVTVGMLQLSTITLRSQTHANAEAEARSNAMMALQMAIAQLQEMAGPDQRITGPARLADPTHPDSWHGVWTPGAVTAATAPAVGTSITNPIATTGTRNNYLTDSRASTPTWKSNWFLGPLVSPGTLAGGKVDLGQWSASERVEVPEMKVGTTGGLAWWTQDLSQQASLAGGVNAAEAAVVGLSAAPRADTTQIANGVLPTDYFVSTTDRNKAITLQTAYLAGGKKDNATAAIPATLENSGNARSYGLFTDPVKGGFKSDMSRFVESSAAVMGNLAAHGLNGITANSSILPGAQHTVTGPRWERLRNWYQLPGAATRTLTGTNPAVIRNAVGATFREGYAVDALRSNSMPLHPVVVDAGFHWDFSPETAAANKIRVHFFPRVTLWNPYNATLTSQRLVFVMPHMIDGAGAIELEMSGSTNKYLRPFPPNVGSCFAPDSVLSNYTNWATNYVGFGQTKIFTIEATTFEPGECLVFTPKIAGGGLLAAYDDSNPANNVLTASQPVGKENFYLDKTPFYPFWANTLTPRIAGGETVICYRIGTPWTNWRPRPFLLKAAPPSGALSANDVVNTNAYPTLQRLFMTDSGAGSGDTFVSTIHEQNNNVIGPGSPWLVFAAARNTPPLYWHYRYHTAWIDDLDEIAANPGGKEAPYATALMADWNPLASVASRTPSSFVQLISFAGLVNKNIDLHIGAWYRCKGPIYAWGSNNSWGVFLNGKARGCPFGDPRNNASQLSFPLIDIPNPSLPLQSIGTLRNVPLSPWTWHPVKPIGSSRTSIHAAKNATAIPAIANMAKPWDNTVSVQKNFDEIIQHPDHNGEILLYDLAYEANRELWDGTFASSWSQSAGWNGIDRLPNRQYVTHPGVNDPNTLRTLADAAATRDTYGLWLPAYLLANEGAFNVNCTSPSAWKAVLGGLRNLSRANTSGAVGAGEPPHPFAKFRQPNSNNAQWGGRLSLTDAQIATLADQIVNVIKERGPFLGVSDFVNRRLDNGISGNRGALEEALIRANLANSTLKSVVGVPSDTGTAVPAANRAVYTNASTNLLEGASGYIEQADLLEPLGGSLCARGDTFRIRATGASYDNKGKLLCRVTCEATVVRCPDYVVATDIQTPGTTTTGNSALVLPTTTALIHPINQKFGRRFKILNFKQLSNINEL